IVIAQHLALVFTAFDDHRALAREADQPDAGRLRDPGLAERDRQPVALDAYLHRQRAVLFGLVALAVILLAGDQRHHVVAARADGFGRALDDDLRRIDAREAERAVILALAVGMFGLAEGV